MTQWKRENAKSKNRQEENILCTGKKSQGTSGKFRKVTHRRTKRFDQFKRSDFKISHAYSWAARSDRCGAELAYPYCAPQALPQNKREPEPYSMTLRLRVARSSIERDAQWDRNRTQIFPSPRTWRHHRRRRREKKKIGELSKRPTWDWNNLFNLLSFHQLEQNCDLNVSCDVDLCNFGQSLDFSACQKKIWTLLCMNVEELALERNL